MASTDLNPELTLLTRLQQAGLDGEYWAKIFKENLGISSPKQITFLGAKDFEGLNIASRHEWELEALRRFLNISEASLKTYRSEHRDEQQKRQDTAKQLLQDVKDIQKPGMEYTEEQVKTRRKELQSELTIAEDKCLHQSDKSSVDDVIKRFDSYIADTGKLAENTNVYTPSQIIVNASGGMALRGVLVGDECEPKRIVMCVPPNVKLMSPMMPQLSDITEHSSKKQSDAFETAITTMGFGFAIGLKGDKFVFKGEAGVSVKHSKEEMNVSHSHTQSRFHSLVKYYVVPVAAFELNPCDLKLSPDVLDALIKLEPLVIGNNNEHTHAMCYTFFNKYGTHINTGLLHLGGVHMYTATYSSETEQVTNTTKATVIDAVDAFANMSNSGIGVNFGGSINANYLKSHAHASKFTEQSELSNVHLRSTYIGGPTEVSSIAIWRKGLIERNSTWVLIDTGKSLVGIWDLISNHNEFVEPGALATTLQTVWRKEKGLPIMDDTQRFIASRHKLDDMSAKVKLWMANPNILVQCKTYLNTLVEEIDALQQATGTNVHWVNELCQKLIFSDFLGKIVDLKDQIPSKDIAMIKYNMRQLIAPVGHINFDGKGAIQKWLNEVCGSRLNRFTTLNADAQSIPELLLILRENCLPKLACQHPEPTMQIRDRGGSRAMLSIVMNVNHCMRSLTSQHEKLFLKTYLFQLEYDCTLKRFNTVLTSDKLEKALDKMDEDWRKFKALKGGLKLDAFLINVLLNSFPMNQVLETSAFNDMIEGIKPGMLQPLKGVLDEHVVDRKTLVHITRRLAQGEMYCPKPNTFDLGSLEDFLMSFMIMDDFENQFKSPENRHYRKTEDSKVKNYGYEFISKLNLNEYYPGQISLQQANAVKEYHDKPTVCDLPWKLIQSIIRIDYTSRDRCISDLDTQDNYDREEDNFERDLGESSDHLEKDKSDLNPLDVLLASFSSCDDILRQVLAQKLFVCKLAIPFIYPLGLPSNLVMSLWALKTIIVKCQGQKDWFETPVTDQPFPIITFVRLGRPSLSKSKLMNDILRTDTHHTFFNHECPNSASPRIISNGLVECSWFLPAGSEHDRAVFKDVTLLLNLRGDSSTYPRQMETLNAISSMMVVIVDVENLKETLHIGVFERICKAAKKVILLMTSEQETFKHIKAVWINCAEQIGKAFTEGVKRVLSRTLDGLKNPADLKNEVCTHISNLLPNLSKMSIEDAATTGQRHGMLHHEYSIANERGKELAERIMKHLSDKVESKKNVLPLQCDKWLEYSAMLKKQYREVCKQPAFKSEKHMEDMVVLRQKQMVLCNSLTLFYKEFLLSLVQSNREDVMLYFLHWLKILLDSRSREHAPLLHMQFQRACEYENPGLKNKEEPKAHYEQHQVNTSLGLEHLFRELGQLYEAIYESKETFEGKLLKLVEYFPCIAARLMLKGHPLELVDGDASNVPITWIKAVLSQLKCIIGDTRLFVISILGIQSSGKSTLLNTMFGLQLPVSVGRCTRGAFMHLISVERADQPMRYIAVIDTEGLRATHTQSRNHDNEFATLVIGLGDITLINIKGENTSDINDTLQMAVHAFLRMKMTNSQLNLNQACMFLYQNVSDFDTKGIMDVRHDLKKKLDMLTEEAAEEEKIPEIKTFDMMIKFDVQDHVWFFSDLWNGDPPMAAANPGYSTKVQDIVTYLMDKHVQKQKTFLTISDFSARLDDLRKGILAEDFVFSFRNSFELKAYNELESKFSELQWKFESSVEDWERKMESKIRTCECRNKLNETFSLILIDLYKVVEKNKAIFQSYLETFFETSPLHDILILWKQTKRNTLTYEAKQRSEQSNQHLLAIKNEQYNHIWHREKWGDYETFLMEAAVELADSLKDGELVTDSKLEETFDMTWVHKVEQYKSRHVSEGNQDNIDVILEGILLEMFHTNGKLLRDELGCHRLSEPIDCLSIHGSLDLDHVTDDDVILRPTIKDKVVCVRTDPLLLAKDKAVDVTNSIFNEIDVYLWRLRCQNTRFQKSNAVAVIKILKSNYDNYNKDSKKFQFRPGFIIRQAVYVSRHCVSVFTEMRLEYEKRHGIETKLSACREPTFNVFKNKVKKSTQEKIAATLLCDKLEKIIENTVTKAVMREVAGEVITDFSRNKQTLIKEMLKDLASKSNFENYKYYISNANTFTVKWVTQYTNEKMFSKESPTDISRYGELAMEGVNPIIKCVVKSIEHANMQVNQSCGKGLSEWITNFCKRVEEEIVVGDSTFRQIRDYDVVDFANFQRIILNQLEVISLNLKTSFCGKTADTVEWLGLTPYWLIMNNLWGCPLYCPFCSEPCSGTSADHYSRLRHNHSCVQHRPQGVRGQHWGSTSGEYKKNHLSTEPCSYLVAKKAGSFVCGGCSKCRQNMSTTLESKVHCYESVNAFLEEWDIAPDPTNTGSLYWKWFMATYQHSLKRWHGKELIIPDKWCQISKEEAIEDLWK